MTNRMGLSAEATNSTTQVCADAETAQPAPAGQCRYCKKTDVTLRRVTENVRAIAEEVPSDGSTRPLIACDACLAIVERGLAQYVTDRPEPEPELPPTVEARAHDAGVAAVNAFKAQWQAEMSAYENEREAIRNGGAEPVAWLAEDPCDSWCVGGLDHNASTHPADRTHFGASTLIPLVTMEAVVVSYPETWAPPQVQLSLERHYREREARVYLAVDDKRGLHATLAEAEEIGNALLDLVAQARGETSST